MRRSFNSATSWDTAISVRESQLCGKACLQTFAFCLLKSWRWQSICASKMRGFSLQMASGCLWQLETVQTHTKKLCFQNQYWSTAFEATCFNAVKCIHRTHSLASVFCRECRWTSPSNSLWMTSAHAQSDTKYAHPLITTTSFPMKQSLLNFST